MNFHNNEWIMNEIKNHFITANELISSSNIVGVFCQGSQNYGLDYENSDVDTKCIIVPSFKDICLLKEPISTTHIRENNSHVDLKDIRKYCQCFRKQNLNFLEILFTDYKVMNPYYENQWDRLVGRREKIARMNPCRAVKSMYGIAGEKFHAMCHPYPSKLDIIEKYHYDGKQVSHLIRVDDYLERYIEGESYESCLKPSPEKRDEIMAYKLQQVPFEIAKPRAEEVFEHTKILKNKFCENKQESEDEEMRLLLEDVQYQIMKQAIKLEI